MHLVLILFLQGPTWPCCIDPQILQVLLAQLQPKHWRLGACSRDPKSKIQRFGSRPTATPQWTNMSVSKGVKFGWCEDGCGSWEGPFVFQEKGILLIILLQVAVVDDCAVSGFFTSWRWPRIHSVLDVLACISHAGYLIPWFRPSHTEIWWWRAVETGLKHAAWMHIGYAGYIVQSGRMSHIDGNVKYV